MATNLQDNSKVTSPALASGEPPDDTVYESSLVPVLWLVVPFVLVLLYGAFSS
jgi:hypothetical protein